MQLLKKQEHAIYYLKDSQTKEIIYGGGAGGGKTALGCLWLIENCQIYHGSRWLMGRAKLKTLKETTLNTFFELASNLKITNQFEYNAQANIIKWNNGSEILLKDLFFYPSDPEFDSLGSLEICGAFIDECSQITYKAWQIVKSRCRYKLTEFGITPKILGTCNPSKNWTYSEFYKPASIGELRSDRAFIQALPKDNPHLPPSYIEALNSLDKNSRLRLLDGVWEYDDDPTCLISFDAIQAIFSNIYVKAGVPVITCDVARFGSDAARIFVWLGFKVVEIVSFPISATTDIQNAINALRIKYKVQLNNIIVDEDGVGGGVVDNLRCSGFVNNSTPYNKQYTHLKAECGYKLAEMIDEIFIECELSDKDNKMIVEELEQLKTYDNDKDGKLKILPKEKIKENIGRSPDYLDNFIMRMFTEVKPNHKPSAPNFSF